MARGCNLTMARKPAVALISDVTDLDHEGRGIAHHEGKTAFIADALPGERIEWVPFKRQRNFDEGRLRTVLTSSADRVAPKCAHFGVCGGCVLQHLAPGQQLAFKQEQLMQALERIGRVKPEVVLPSLSADTWAYRRRARLACRWVPAKQKTVVGFRERSTSYIADLQRCEVLQPPFDALVEPLSKLISATSVRDRVPQIELAAGDTGATIIIRVLSDLTPADEAAIRTFADQHAITVLLQPGGYETIAYFAGPREPLIYRLPDFDVQFEFEPNDFVQVNAGLNRAMVSRAIELLQPTATDRVLDLFCGLGNFSLPLARRSGHVTGIEGEPKLIARARLNAERQGFLNVNFITANLADQPEVASWATQSYDKVLLDPPRTGAREVLPVIARSGAKRVVYISCHPGSLARDAGLLVQEHGYTLRAAGVMDMFPHTAHVESLAVFEE
jgi:23S rRNA (uracil1939-C5)-methyltransferase